MKLEMRTENLPTANRILARLVHKLQLITIKYRVTMPIYYRLAAVHFSLHERGQGKTCYSLTEVIYKLDRGHSNEHTQQRKHPRGYIQQLGKLAIRRHMRIIVQAGLMNKKQIKVFRKQIARAFSDGILRK